MIKRILKIIGGLLLIFLCAITVLFFYGQYKAEKLNEQVPLEQLIIQEQQSNTYVTWDEIPIFLKEATVAVEDDAFYYHPGIDPISLLRGLLSQLLPFVPDSGGSTITQQVVKNLYQQYNAGWSWKLTEIAMAFRLEDLLDKEQILTLYVNIINYGDGYTGIEEAAGGYFGVEPAALDEAECSLLAGIPQSPNNLQLSNHADAAKSKQLVVLQAMLRNGMIDQAQLDLIYSQSIDYFAGGMWHTLQ